MKKLLVLLFLMLVSLGSYAEQLNNLFGITLYENAEKYVSSNYINSNKYKNVETLSGYFDLDISDKIPAKSPYFSVYSITLDTNNNIHDIYGEKEYPNLTRCKAVLASLLSIIEEKYKIDFEYLEASYPSFEIYSHYHYTSSNNYFAIQCNEDFEDSFIRLQMYLDSEVLGDAVDEFYESGL